jgi:hypothetical protein
VSGKIEIDPAGMLAGATRSGSNCARGFGDIEPDLAIRACIMFARYHDLSSPVSSPAAICVIGATA